MNYVTLRLLGMGPDEGPMTEIRALIHEMGEGIFQRRTRA
jgi:lanosterol synthase